MESLGSQKDPEQRLEKVRAEVILAEQDYVRVRTLIKDQEAVVRGLREQEIELQSTITELSNRKVFLLDELDTAARELTSIRKSKEDASMAMKEAEIARMASLELTKKIENERALASGAIEAEKEAHAIWLNEARRQMEQTLAQTNALRLELQQKKDTLMSALANI
jgi:chromosome segregation ATPase